MSLITIVGMGSGLSYAVADRFAKEGFDVAMIARRMEALETLSATLQQHGRKVRPFAADAGDLTALTTAMSRVHDEMGTPDILVYNAAALHATPALEQSAEGLVDDFRVNIAGAFQAAKLVLPHMIEKQRGTIIFTGGGLAMHPSQAYTSLSIGKAALRSLAFSLAEAVKEANVHVATVTVNGFINPNDARYSPVSIAEQYWHLFQQAPGQFQTELSY